MENVVGIRVQIHPVALQAPTGAVSACDRHSSWREGAGVLVEIRSGYAVPHNEAEEEVRGVKDITSLDENLLREIFLT